MKFILDFFPVLLFFVSYKLYVWQNGSSEAMQSAALLFATPVLMAATALQMAIIYRKYGRLTTIHKFGLWLILGLGAFTLLLRDDTFIRWKPTVLYCLLATILLGGALLRKKNLIQHMLGQHLKLPTVVWSRLNWAWIGYCLFMAAVNAFVVLHYSRDTWMNFKMWGYIFPIVFLALQGVYLYRYIKDAAQSEERRDDPP